MKLRTRLAVAFLTITIVPMLLFYLLVLALSNYQTRSFTKEYGLTEQVDLFSVGSASSPIPILEHPVTTAAAAASSRIPFTIFFITIPSSYFFAAVPGIWTYYIL